MRFIYKTNLVLVLMCNVLFFASCETAYYQTMEKMGVHKRDILVSRVQDARNAQQATKEQFKSTLEKFKAAIQFDGGNLEKKYEQLQDEFEDSQAKAKTVKSRIDDVERVADALFEEWKKELEQYSKKSLKQSSKRKLQETQRQYRKLIRAMRRAESKVDPVLAAFQDHVLFLKHNLNARAIASLDKELIIVQSDVNTLIEEMEASIQEADRFLKSIQ
ncbi:MAG: DUF2959 domain-containing protein [SAR324 cluster bacterium]|nr:DUF2959 domain-containing protein [SAR324 cluster bacterium]